MCASLLWGCKAADSTAEGDGQSDFDGRVATGEDASEPLDAASGSKEHDGLGTTGFNCKTNADCMFRDNDEPLWCRNQDCTQCRAIWGPGCPEDGGQPDPDSGTTGDDDAGADDEDSGATG